MKTFLKILSGPALFVLFVFFIHLDPANPRVSFTAGVGHKGISVKLHLCIYSNST